MMTATIAEFSEGYLNKIMDNLDLEKEVIVKTTLCSLIKITLTLEKSHDLDELNAFLNTLTLLEQTQPRNIFRKRTSQEKFVSKLKRMVRRRIVKVQSRNMLHGKLSLFFM